MFEIMNSMNGIFVIIGGNLGNREQNLSQCKLRLQEKVGLIIKSSAIYETASWGKIGLPSYLNQVLQIVTHLDCKLVLSACLSIEQEMGRTRDNKWSSRTIDIDILFYNQEIWSTNDLSVPHPHLHNRQFVLTPLMEIAPDFFHPILQKTISELHQSCTDNLAVQRKE